MEQVIIIGAGPCGLSAAAELKEAGLDPLVIEKGSIVHSIYRYPTYLTFHSTPELLEIGGIPFVTPNEKPTRLEGLNYYRMVAERKKLRIRTYEEVTAIHRTDQGFRLSLTDRLGRESCCEAQHVVIATGYFDHPNELNIPGEELAKVSHYYTEAHPYAGLKIVIVGGNNSAMDAALELVRVGAEVTIVYRGAELSPYIKAWTRPVIESMMEKKRIRMLFESELKEIREDAVRIAVDGQEIWIDNDFVLALTGFKPNREPLVQAGVTVNEQTGAPLYDPETMRTNVPGLYIAGVVAAGNRANDIFIETGRHHGRLIARDLTSH
ncbi:YpdA family putative bacillithiol disulfide reductase [Gorillibacterium timonense]|uniref:YpdA family putative bacillithiol disulfide reductase n=1 Tax=Gorillibacterium timonense TaxID=1689269 RepID=UPI00071D6213|nr:YpdA family putative bacillithiol disulfide reductase [Gorillibacterium timonense]